MISASVRNICQFISCCLVSLTPGAFSPRPALCTDDLTFIFMETFLYVREDLANHWAMSWPCCETVRTIRHHCTERNALLWFTLSCFQTNVCDFLHMIQVTSVEVKCKKWLGSRWIVAFNQLKKRVKSPGLSVLNFKYPPLVGFWLSDM
jgi:hypothetical protein